MTPTGWQKFWCRAGHHTWEQMGAWACDPGVSYRQRCLVCPKYRYYSPEFPSLDRHVPLIRQMAGLPEPRWSSEKTAFAVLVFILIIVVICKIFIYAH
jgi:hypothetical protein